MSDNNVEKIKEINKLIMSVAMSGEIDCAGPYVINYRKIGCYVLAVIEDYAGKWNYRIFVCNGSFCYSRNQMREPVEDFDNLRYVYGCNWNAITGEYEIAKFQNGEWVADLGGIVELERDDMNK